VAAGCASIDDDDAGRVYCARAHGGTRLSDAAPPYPYEPCAVRSHRKRRLPTTASPNDAPCMTRQKPFDASRSRGRCTYAYHMYWVEKPATGRLVGDRVIDKWASAKLYCPVFGPFDEDAIAQISNPAGYCPIHYFIRLSLKFSRLRLKLRLS
jgi:hypothetical protein